MLELNKIYCGDCLEVMKNIDSGSVDMVLADLPYGTTQNKWDSVIDFDMLWVQYKRICKKSAAIVLTAQSPFDKVLGCSNLQMLKYEWIWEKTSATGFFNAKKMPLKAHENILVFYERLPTYNPQMTHGHIRKTGTKRNVDSECYGKAFKTSVYDSTDRYPRSVLKFSSDKQHSKLHPTQKPLSLFEYLMKTYSNIGDSIVDNCIGSGTTAVAAINTGRNFIGIELKQKYVNIANQRIKNAEPQLF